jgi:hypothetical protein
MFERFLLTEQLQLLGNVNKKPFFFSLFSRNELGAGKTIIPSQKKPAKQVVTFLGYKRWSTDIELGTWIAFTTSHAGRATNGDRQKGSFLLCSGFFLENYLASSCELPPLHLFSLMSEGETKRNHSSYLQVQQGHKNCSS